MTIHRRTWLTLLIGLLLTGQTAPAIALELAVTTDRETALYERGETVRFRILLRDAAGSPVTGQRVSYRVTKDGVGEITAGDVETRGEPVEIEAALGEPGFLRCDVSWTPAEPDAKKLTARAGAGIEPTRIAPSMPVPDDFDAFWSRQKARLAATPMAPELTAVASPDEAVECFDVQIACAGGAPVSGYYARPRDAEPNSLPAVLFTHGAGVRSARLNTAVQGVQRLEAIALDLNAHGIPNGRPDSFYRELAQGDLRDYRHRNADDAEDNYFVGMYLRLLQALAFLKAQPEWDGQTLLVIGSSQGGGQAIAAAGLDPDVTFIAASVPAMCDHTGFAADRAVGWPRLVRDPQNAEAVRAARYVDAMNFATRTDAEAVVSVGFIDHVCPPTSVYAAFNNLAGSKTMIERPTMGHSFPKDLQQIFNEHAGRHIARQAGE